MANFRVSAGPYGPDTGAVQLTSYAELLEKAVNSIMAPVLADAGFRRRSRRSHEWTRNDQIQVRVQRDSKANDPYSGGSFKLELEVSSDGRFEHKLAGRVLAEQLLDERQRARFLDKRNEVAERWGTPPAEHIAIIPEFLREQYLRHFTAATELERQLGMRFRTQAEANEWIELLAREMPTLIARAEALSPRLMYLGRTFEWCARPPSRAQRFASCRDRRCGRGRVRATPRVSGFSHCPTSSHGQEVSERDAEAQTKMRRIDDDFGHRSALQLSSCGSGAAWGYAAANPSRHRGH